MAQLNLEEGYGTLEEAHLTQRRHDCAQKRENLREPNVDNGGQTEQLTEFHHCEEKQRIEIANREGKRDSKGVPVVGEGGNWRTEQSSSGHGDLKGKRKASDKLAGIPGEKEEESDSEVLEWRISDVFSGLDSESRKNHPKS